MGEKRTAYDVMKNTLEIILDMAKNVPNIHNTVWNCLQEVRTIENPGKPKCPHCKLAIVYINSQHKYEIVAYCARCGEVIIEIDD